MRNLRHKLLAVALLFASVPVLSIAQAKHTSKSAAKPAASSASSSAAPLDINTATAGQLKAFNGMGDP